MATSANHSSVNTSGHPSSSSPVLSDENDLDLVKVWLQTDPLRWIAGILGGLVAAALACLVAGLLARAHGMEFLFPVKLMATPIVGSAATEYTAPFSSILAGAIFIAVIGAFWGLVFGHFVFATRLLPLLGMGFTWGAFTWVFIWNLMLPSFRTIHDARISPAAAFLICMTFGLGMTSTAIFKKVVNRT